MKIVFATNNAHKLEEARRMAEHLTLHPTTVKPGEGNACTTVKPCEEETLNAGKPGEGKACTTVKPGKEEVCATGMAGEVCDDDCRLQVLSLADIGCHDDIPETADTLEGNALIKARWVKERYGYDCFADDTGLMVDALDGAPGVYSARYAGPHCSPADNIVKLMGELKDKDVRTARFATVVALSLGGEEHLFHGKVEGEIARESYGHEGFGYDPVFVPGEGDGRSFAQMDGAEKDAISHRGRAMRALFEFLDSHGRC